MMTKPIDWLAYVTLLSKKLRQSLHEISSLALQMSARKDREACKAKASFFFRYC